LAWLLLLSNPISSTVIPTSVVFIMADSYPTQSIDELKAENSTLYLRIDRLESDLLLSKKKLELIEAEQHNNIEQLKQVFSQTEEKRKESFNQLKQKLSDTVEIIKRLQSKQAEDKKLMESLEQEKNNLNQQISAGQTASAGKESSYNTEKANLQAEIKKLESLNTALLEEKSLVSARESEHLSEVSRLKQSLDRFEQKELASKSNAAISIVESNNNKANNQVARVTEGCLVSLEFELEGEIRIEWLRSFCGAKYVAIGGTEASKKQYLVTVDDIGASLRATATNVQNGIVVQAEIGPVIPSFALVTHVQEHLKKFDTTFPVECVELDGSKVPRQITLTKEKIKFRNGKQTVTKNAWGPYVTVKLDLHSADKFLVAIDANLSTITFVAPTSNDRNIIVQAIRLFNYFLHTKPSYKYGDHKQDSIQALTYLLRCFNEGTAEGLINPNTLGLKVNVGSLVTAAVQPAFSPAANSSNVANVSSIATPKSNLINSGLGLATVASNSKALKKDDKKSNHANTPASTASSAALSKGEEPEVDADGFIIPKNRGFAEQAKGFAEDSSDEETEAKTKEVNPNSPDQGGEAAIKPAIQVSINAEARPIAKGDTLKELTKGLAAPGSLGKAKKGKKELIAARSKTLQPEKKKKSPANGPAPALAIDSLASIPTPNSDSRVSTANTAITELNAPSTPLTNNFPQPTPSKSVIQSTTEQEETSEDDQDEVQPSPAAIANVNPAASSDSPSASSLSVANFQFQLVETMFAQITEKSVHQYAVWGDLLINRSGDFNTEQYVTFSLTNQDKLHKVIPNTANTTQIGASEYKVHFPAETTSVTALKYRSPSDASNHECPLALESTWTRAPNSTVLDVKYKRNNSNPNNLLNKYDLNEVKLLIQFQPTGTISECKSAQPKVLYAQSQQKLMWNLNTVPANATEFSLLHAELVNNGKETEVTPVTLSFACNDLPSGLSGVQLNVPNASPQQIQYKVKAGTFTIL
jgi:hypothetical protein